MARRFRYNRSKLFRDIEELIDVDQGQLWLHCLDDHLLQTPDSWCSSEAKTLRGTLGELDLEKAQT